MTFRRLISSPSVRARIIFIAAIPVLGFLANGIAFMVGEKEVARAFATVREADALSEASREFKSALELMRVAAWDFALRPSNDLIKTFQDAHALAHRSLETTERSVAPGNREAMGGVLPRRVNALMANFINLITEQEKVGFTEADGMRRRMRDVAAEVERLINQDMSWLQPADSQRLLNSLLIMRRHEAEFRLNRVHLVQQQFFEEFKTFNKTFDAVVGAAVLKEQLAQLVKTYADTFGEWIESTERTGPYLAVIDLDTQQMLPIADRINAMAVERASAAAAALSASQTRTKHLIVWVGIAAVLIGLALSWVIGRSITRPLGGLAAVMKRLADGDTSARIPATGARDEIGAMARTVIVFRDSILERERLAAIQAEANRARERRSELIAATIARFEQSVEQALTKVRGASDRLETTSTTLNCAADAVSAQARAAESRVGAASENVTAAASSVEELAASIGEIAMQASKSTEVAGRAVSEGLRTARTMTGLGNAATRIGEVVGLIQSIAGQTNLLALNATIEAARAGEAGRGFAVVASEVKSLATETAKATEEIAGQIGAIQSASTDAARAIEQVNAIIEEMSAIAGMVAATVEEQNMAVASIADGANRASLEAKSSAEAMSSVAEASTDARATASDVKSLADTLAVEAESLDSEVRRFLAEVRAA
jgi:methyl-accepting chemotaxis protein